MADAQLSVELQARVDGFVNNLLAAANASDNTSASVTQMSTNISRNIANVNRLNLTQFSTALNNGTLSIQRLGAATSAIRPAISRAGTDFQGFSRVLQDAAFGPGAIANNLAEAGRDIANLGRIARESGQSIGRVLVNSLTGPGGINLALGGFTLALSLASFGLSAWTRLFPGNKKAVEDSKKANDDYADSLDAVQGAQLRGAQNAAKEISVLNTLFNIYQNSNIPLNKRKEAYQEIQRLYPDYFANIKFENELTGSSRVAYDKLTQSIISTAKAKALSAKIGENSVKEEEIATKIFNLSEDLKKSRSSDTSYAKALGGSKETQDILEQIYALDTERLKLKADDLRLQDKLNEKVKEGASIANNFASPGGTLKTEKKLEIPVSPKLELPENPKQIFEDIFKKVNASNAGGALEIPAPSKLTIQGGKKIDLNLGDIVNVTGFDDLIGLEKIIEGAESSIKKLTSLPSLVNVASDALGQSFEAMGAAIASGESVINAAGDIIQKTFADLLSALGQQFITMGAAKVAAGILATPFGGKLVAEGAGLIALGASLKVGGGLVSSAGKSNKTNAPTAFANGGIISGPTLAYMGEYAGARADPEVVAPLSKLKKMLGQTDDAGNPISSDQGTNVFFDQRVEIDGDKLVVLTERVKAKRQRVR